MILSRIDLSFLFKSREEDRSILFISFFFFLSTYPRSTLAHSKTNNFNLLPTSLLANNLINLNNGIYYILISLINY
jgi:hypothetical protein